MKMPSRKQAQLDEKDDKLRGDLDKILQQRGLRRYFQSTVHQGCLQEARFLGRRPW